MSYEKYSQTSSGWTIAEDRNAEPDLRWRITHPEFGTRYFAEHDDILPWTCRHMIERFEKIVGRFRQ